MSILDQFDTVTASEEGAWLHICHQGTDDKVYLDKAQKKPLRIKLKGPDSEVWIAFQRKAMRKSDKEEERSPAEIAEEDADLFAKMTIEWENMPDDVGECNQKNAKALYLKYKDIRIQVLGFVHSRENFTKRPPKD